ncbi:hypothetical protein [Variovorax sp. AFSI2.2]|uniref:hypothetical protein n=1 Tax=Variovorax sp. AFSI2.2 TaxID=3384160 RepID=UPI003EBAF0A5
MSNRDFAYQQSLTGYAKALAENLNSKAERSAVGELIANRNKAMDRRDKVEVQLQDELRRAAKAANTAELLGGISQALQFTQVMTMASGMMGGEAISKSTTAPLKTSADVVRAVQGAGARAAAAAAELELERGQLINAIQGINGKILDAGVKNGIDQPGIFKVYLH